MMRNRLKIRRNNFVHTDPACAAGPDFSEVESMPTTLYGEFPQFDGLTGGELARAAEVKAMIDEEYSNGRCSIMGDSELDNMVRLADKKRHKQLLILGE